MINNIRPLFPVVKDSDWLPIDSPPLPLLLLFLPTLRECRYVEARCRHGGLQQQEILNCFRTASACSPRYSSKLRRAARARSGGEWIWLFQISDCILWPSNRFYTLMLCLRGRRANFGFSVCVWFFLKDKQQQQQRQKKKRKRREGVKKKKKD